MSSTTNNLRIPRAFRRFGRKVLKTVLVFVVLISQLGPYTYIAKPAEAANSIPKLLNYQARITNSAGVPVSDGNLNIWISVYDASTSGTCMYAMRGSCGTPSWKTVTVTDGVFSTLIGDTGAGDNAIPDALFDNNTLYLGITVASDTEMVPRKRITSAPYAFNADRLDDLDASSSGGTTAHIVAATANGNLTIAGDPQGATTSQGSVYINPAGATANETLIGIADNGTNRWMIDKEGDITHSGSLLASAASSTAQFIFRGAASQSQNIFEVQDSATNRVLSVSATATTVTDLIISGTCTGCAGSAATLQTAYDSSTGTTEIFLGSARGALTLADSFSSFGGNLLEIQNRTNGAGDYSARYFTVSSTSTQVIGGSRLIVGSTNTLVINSSGNFESINGVATRFPSTQGAASTFLQNDGAGNLTWASAAGAAATLQTAYDSSTGTTEIFLSSSRGALTLADSFSSFNGNLFEIQDRTNGAGDYSRRYFTVSSTSTNLSYTSLTNGTALSITGGGTNMATGGELIDAQMGNAAAGNGIVVTTSGAYTGTGLIDVNAGNALTTGKLLSLRSAAGGQTTTTFLDIAQTGVTGLFTGNLVNISTTATTGAARFLNIVADSSTIGIGAAISMTSLSTGTGLSITGGGANMGAGGELIDANMGAATAGNGIVVTTTGNYAGTGVMRVVADSMTTGAGTGLLVSANGMTSSTGNAMLVTSTGVYTGANGLFAVTGNSATTGTVARINGSGLTSGTLLSLNGGNAMTGNGAVISATGTVATGPSVDRGLFNLQSNISQSSGGGGTSLYTGGMNIDLNDISNPAGNSVTGYNVSITSNSFTDHTQYGYRGNVLANSGSPIDNDWEAIFAANNADTATGNQITVTSGFLASVSCGTTCMTSGFTVAPTSGTITNGFSIGTTGTVTNGISFNGAGGVVTTDFVMQNGESIDNNVNGTINASADTFQVTPVTATIDAFVVNGSTLTSGDAIFVNGGNAMSSNGTLINATGTIANGPSIDRGLFNLQANMTFGVGGGGTTVEQSGMMVSLNDIVNANNNSVVGYDLAITSNSFADHNQTGYRADILANSGSPVDNDWEALMALNNSDTATGNLIAVTDALLITNSGGASGGIVNAITIGSGSQPITTALNIASPGITTDIRLQNGEVIHNDTDGTIAFTDGTNTLCSIIDGGTTGTLSCTGGAGVTLQEAYDADANGGDVLITTNSTDGDLIIAGDQDFRVTTTLQTIIGNNTHTTGDLMTINGTALTTGDLLTLNGGQMSGAGPGMLVNATATAHVGYSSGLGLITLQANMTYAGSGFSSDSPAISINLNDIAQTGTPTTVGYDLNITSNGFAAHTQRGYSANLNANSGSPTDNTWEALYYADNADTATGNQITVTSGYQANASVGVTGMTNGFLVSVSGASSAITNGFAITAPGGSSVTNGISFSGATGITTDFVMQNSETIDNNSDGVINTSANTLQVSGASASIDSMIVTNAAQVGADLLFLNGSALIDQDGTLINATGTKRVGSTSADLGLITLFANMTYTGSGFGEDSSALAIKLNDIPGASANSVTNGIDLAITSNSFTSHTQRGIRAELTANSGSPVDQTWENLLLLNNADTATGNLIAVTDALLITNSGAVSGGIVNAITIGSGSQPITTALNLASTGITTDIRLQNGEVIHNDTDGTITFSDGTNVLCTIVDGGTTGSLSCTGGITASTTLNQAYNNSTSTTEIFLTPSLGALTIADTFSGTGNIFEIQNRTNAAGDYSKRYMTVSATSTQFATNNLRLYGAITPTEYFEIDYSTSAVTLKSVSNDPLRIGANGADNINIDILGNVGINDLTPDFNLETVGSFAVSGTSGGDGNRFLVDSVGQVGIGTATPSARLTISASTTSPTNNIFEIQNSTNSARYLAVSSTNTTIGSSSSTYAITPNARIAGNLTPTTDDTFDLGDYDRRWRDLWLGPGSLHIGTSETDEGFLSYDTANNIFRVNTDGTTNGDISVLNDLLYIDKSSGAIGVGDGDGYLASTFSVYDTQSNNDNFVVYDDNLGNATAIWARPFSVTAGRALYLQPTGAITSGQSILSSFEGSYTTGDPTVSGVANEFTRTITNGGASTITVTGALASFNSVNSGATTFSADVVRISEAETISSGVALNVDYAGTGFVARFEDNGTAFNDDTTPFVIDATGRVGVGTASPTSMLTLSAPTASPTTNVFEIQNTSGGGGYSQRYFTVSSTSTTISGDLVVTGSCSGCGGGSTTIQQAFDNATGTAEIFLGSARGALTLADSFSGFGGNLFEIQDRTNGTGDYSRRYFTVNATSTLINAVNPLAGYEVGIGTASPNAELEVFANDGGSGTIRVANSSGFGEISADGSGLKLMSQAAKDISFTIDTTQRMEINANGNVVIGQNAATPDALLSIRDDQTAGHIFEVFNQNGAGAYTSKFFTVSTTSTLMGLTSANAALTGYSVGIGQATPTARLHVTPDANTTALQVSGYSVTGSNANTLASLTGTWNTSGAPVGLFMNITDTASSGNAQLLAIQQSGVSRFVISKTGATTVTLNNALPITGTSAIGLVNTDLSANNFSSIFFGDGLGAGSIISNQFLSHGASTVSNVVFQTRDNAGTLATRLTVGATGTSVVGDFSFTGTCTSCGGSVNLNQAYNNSTSSNELYLTPSLGALTIADTVGDALGNLFEIQDRTNSAGDYSRRYFTVSSTGTKVTSLSTSNDSTFVAEDAGTGVIEVISNGSNPTSLYLTRAASGNSWRLVDDVVTAESLVFSFNSTERMRLTSAGNLALGTTDTTPRLNVRASTESPTTNIFQISNSTDSSRYLTVSSTATLLNNSVQISNPITTANQYALYVEGGPVGTANGSIRFQGTNSSSHFYYGTNQDITLNPGQTAGSTYLNSTAANTGHVMVGGVNNVVGNARLTVISTSANTTNLFSVQNFNDSERYLTVSSTNTSLTYNGTITSGSAAFNLTANGLTTGTGASFTSTASSMTGHLVNITSNASSAANTGNLLNLQVNNALNRIKALQVSYPAVTSNLGTGGVNFNFAGNHTGVGFGIDDVTTNGNAMTINASNLQTGAGLLIDSTSSTSMGVGSALKIVGPSTCCSGSNSVGIAMDVRMNGNPTGNNSAAMVVFQANGLTSGIAQKIGMGDSASTGTGLLISGRSNITSASWLQLNKTISGATSQPYTGNFADIDYDQAYSGGANINSTGTLFNVSRYNQVNGASAWPRFTGAVANFVDDLDLLSGWVNHAANVVRIEEKFAGATNSALFVIDSATGGAAAYFAGAFTPLTIASRDVNPTYNLFEVQNSSVDSASSQAPYTQRYFTVSATSTTVAGDLIINGTCTGCGGSLNLNQAYLNSTGTANISITPSLGAVTIADTFSGTGDIFQIQDRTNSAGDYSRRYLTVSSTSTNISTGNEAYALNLATGAGVKTITMGSTTGASAVTITGGTGLMSFGAQAVAHTTTIGSTTGASALNLQAGTGLITIASSATTGNGAQLNANAMTTGTALAISNTNATTFNGELLTLTKTGATGNTAFTSDIANITYSQTFNAASTLNSTGNVLDISRAITTNNASQNHTVSGALATFTDNGTVTLGTLTHSANVLALTQNYASASGAVLKIQNNGAGLDAQGTDGSWAISRVGNASFLGGLDVGASSSTEIVNFANARIGSNLTPTVDATFDLGDYNRRWRELWLAGGSANIAYDQSGTTIMQLGWSDVQGRRAQMMTFDQPLQITTGASLPGMYMDRFGRVAIGRASTVNGTGTGAAFLHIDAASGTQRSLAITFPANQTQNVFEAFDASTSLIDVAIDNDGAFRANNTMFVKILPNDTNFIYATASGGRSNQFKPRNANATAISIEPTSGMTDSQNLLEFNDFDSDIIYTRFDRMGRLVFGATNTDPIALVTVATNTATTQYFLELRDLTSPNGAWSQRYLTVSSTGTQIGFGTNSNDLDIVDGLLRVCGDGTCTAATSATVDGEIYAEGDIEADGDLRADGGDLLTSAGTFNVAAGATTVAIAGGSGSTGCTIDSSGNFTCTGTVSGSGSGGTLQTAYDSSTSTAEIYLSSTRGALTIADSLSSFGGNLFEIQDRTTAAGDYERRYFTVSATGTVINTVTDFGNLAWGGIGAGNITAADDASTSFVGGQVNVSDSAGVVTATAGNNLMNISSGFNRTSSAQYFGQLLSLRDTGTPVAGTSMLNLRADNTAAGNGLEVVMDSLTTGNAVFVTSGSTALTTGSLFTLSSATTATVATNGIVEFEATGNFTSTANVGLLNLKANSTAAGTIQNITGTALTTGRALNITAGGTGLTTGSALFVTSPTTGAVATNGIVSLNATGNYTSTSNAGLLNVSANSTTAGTIQNISGTALTTGTALNITTTAMTSGTSTVITGGNALTTGGALRLQGQYVQSSSTKGSLVNLSVFDQSAAGFGNTSFTNAINVQSNFNSVAGSGIRELTAINIDEPTFSGGSNCAGSSSILCTWNGMRMRTPTKIDANAGATSNFNGLKLTAGLLRTNAATTMNWTGLDITMPELDETSGGTITSTALKITGNTNSGNNGEMYAMTTSSNAGNVGFGTLTPTERLTIGASSNVFLMDDSDLIGAYAGIGQFMNVLRGSNEFDTSNWFKTNAVVTADTHYAPDGNLSADTIAGSAVGAFARQGTTGFAPLSSTAITGSVWLKTTSGTVTMSLRLDGSLSGNGTAKTISVNTEWKRYFVTQTLSGTVTFNLFTDANTVVAWGAQVEQATTPGPLLGTLSGGTVQVMSATATGMTFSSDQQGIYFAGASNLSNVPMITMAAAPSNGSSQDRFVLAKSTSALTTGLQWKDSTNTFKFRGSTDVNFFSVNMGSSLISTDVSTTLGDNSGQDRVQLQLNGTTTGPAFYAAADGITTQTGAIFSFDGLTSGAGVGLNVTSTSTGITAANIGQFDWTPSFTGAQALTNVGGTGNGLFLFDRNPTLNTSGTVVMPSAMVEILDRATVTSGTYTHSGDSLNVNLANTAATGNAVRVINQGTGGSFRVDDVLSDGTPFFIDAAGAVHIGGTAPGQELDVEGDIQADFNGTVTTNGVCHSGAASNVAVGDRDLVICNGSAVDVAEFYPVVNGTSAVAGEILVSTDQTLTYSSKGIDPYTGMQRETMESQTVSMLDKSATPYDARIIGIVSTSPDKVLGRNLIDVTSSTAPVALTGRVPTKVSDENGPIAVGDPITTSSVEGIGMKATKPGMIVGYALSAWNGTGQGTVNVFVKPTWHSGMAIKTDGSISFFNDDFTFDATATSSASGTSFNSFGLNFRGSTWNGASNTAITRNISVLNETSDISNYQLAFRNDDNNLLASLNQAGDLAIAGSLTVEGGFDYAEMFPAVPDIEAGDIVMIDPEDANGYGVKKTQTAYENSAIGVISTKPGFLTGKKEDGSQPVALAGRVPVKVNMEGGEILPGDPITSSSTPGVGMKATEAGRVIGLALQGMAQDGTVMIFVNPSWWNGPMPIGGSAAEGTLSIEQDSILDFKNSVLTNVAAIISTNGSWSITSDGYLTAEKVEAKEVVTETLKIKTTSGTPERTVGVGRITAGGEGVLITNPAVTADSLIIVTFETNPGANWWIEEKQAGQFMLKMAQPAHVDQKFTYWIVPVDGALDQTPPDETGSGSGTPETPPPTGSGSGTDETGSGSGTEETGSGSGTEETP